MYNFQQKKKIRKILTSRGMFFLLLVVTIFLARGAFGVYTKQRESKLALAKVSQNLEDIKKRESSLATSIEEMKTPQGIEREIRGKFNVAKEGEEVIMIIEAPKPIEEAPPLKKNIIQSFLGWLTSE